MDTINFINKQGKSIVPVRIREARISRGLSLTDLAEKLGVTKQSISKYELGTVNVPTENLIKISNILDFPISFFFKEKIIDNKFSPSITFFRSLRATSKKSREAQQQKIYFIEEINQYLSNFIEFPDVDIPNHLIQEYNIGLKDIDIEEATIKLRDYWGVGTKPISNLTNVLLKKGFIISRVGLDTYNIDAFSRWEDGRPYIVLGSDKECAVRSRFDLAHELGHLIIHSDIEEELFKKNIKTIEKEANRFASAFLLPAEEFSKDIYNLSLNNFLYLKEKWKVSIAAMIYRCHDLNLISDFQKASLFRQLAIKKWNRTEPLDDILEFERPNIFGEAFKLLIDNKIVSPNDIIDELCFNEDYIEDICFLENDFFKKMRNHKKSNLRLIR